MPFVMYQLEDGGGRSMTTVTAESLTIGLCRVCKNPRRQNACGAVVCPTCQSQRGREGYQKQVRMNKGEVSAVPPALARPAPKPKTGRPKAAKPAPAPIVETLPRGRSDGYTRIDQGEEKPWTPREAGRLYPAPPDAAPYNSREFRIACRKAILRAKNATIERVCGRLESFHAAAIEFDGSVYLTRALSEVRPRYWCATVARQGSLWIVYLASSIGAQYRVPEDWYANK